MTAVKIYDVVVNGVKTRMKLDEAGAKRYGVWQGKAVDSADAANKAMKAAPRKAAAGRKR